MYSILAVLQIKGWVGGFSLHLHVTQIEKNVRINGRSLSAVKNCIGAS